MVQVHPGPPVLFSVSGSDLLRIHRPCPILCPLKTGNGRTRYQGPVTFGGGGSFLGLSDSAEDALVLGDDFTVPKNASRAFSNISSCIGFACFISVLQSASSLRTDLLCLTPPVGVCSRSSDNPKNAKDARPFLLELEFRRGTTHSSALPPRPPVLSNRGGGPLE